MAGPGRTVRLSGLPTDMDNNRLQDKLLIHFLRGRNGGGEIDSVTIVKATPLSALITFEDSSVAHRVLRHSPHILEVDGKRYKLTATKHQEGLDPDQVILSLSATVDYKWLPGGVKAMTDLRKSHREIQINHTASERGCTLFGSYSKVQAALSQLLSYPGGPGGPEVEENKNSGQASPNGSCSVQTSQKPQASDVQNGKPAKQREQRKRDNPDRPPNEEDSAGDGWESTANTENPPCPTEFMEDFSLIVDADVFQYLQERCKKEYQQILSRHGVEAISETNQGLTTLFLQAADPAGLEDGQERLKLARKAISQLYQENETKICGGQLPKAILSPRGGLQRALEQLGVRFPNLLLNQDEQNVYLIGSSRDVSEGKSVLLLDHGGVREQREDVLSPKTSWYESGSSPAPSKEEGVPVMSPSTPASLDEPADQILRSEEEELRADGRRYKLAARFKDSKLAGLGSRPADFSFRVNSSPSRQMSQGPVLGRDVLSEPVGSSGETVSRVQNTGGDILFRLPSPSASTSLMTDKMEARPKTSTSPFSTTPSSERSALPPFGSGSTLKRASSFSGMPQQKAQVVGQKSQDDSSRPAARPRERSSSFSRQTVRDKQVHDAEVTLSQTMWLYLKEAYGPLVEDLTTDVQVKERLSDGSRDLTVTIRGADSSRVRRCQERLQKLVDSVRTDFSVQEVRLSDLGVTDSEDETLQACCSEVRSRFKKVTVHVGKKALYLLGPNQMSSQVAATLREVFSGAPEQHVVSVPSTSLWDSAASLQINVSQKSGLHLSSSPQVVLRTPPDDYQWKTTYRRDFSGKEVVSGSYSQSSVRKDHVTKEKVKMADTVEEQRQTAEQFSQSLKRNHTGSSPVKGLLTPAVNRDQTTEVQNTTEESSSGQVYSCLCGVSVTSLTRTKCGLPMCPKCQETSHVHCRVCSEADQRPWGVRGEIRTSRLNISVPGHNKDAAIKITYRIPDGVQGEAHPSPGKPFKGGVFEAFLPDNEWTKRLLPRLQRAFSQGLTFTVVEQGADARVTWDCIPHKTKLQGGKDQKGYPDSTYLKRLSGVLTSHGID